jgi:lipoprotein-releasing system permease protein
VALISLISVIGIALAVAVLIIVMSVMNGFRSELLARTLGFSGHMHVTGSVLITDPEPSAPPFDADPSAEAPEAIPPPEGAAGPSPADRALTRLRAVPGVEQAFPIIEAYSVAQGPSQLGLAVVRGMTPADVRATRIVADNILPGQGSLQGFGEGEFGGDLILIGSGLASTLGLSAGDPLTLLSPSGEATAFGSAPRSKTYTIGGVFEIGMSQFDAAYVYMPLEQAQIFFGREGTADSIELKLGDADDVDRLRPLVEQAAGQGALVRDWRDDNAAYFGALQVERNVMRLILMLIVTIAAMNIISGLVMLVKNKGRDVAVLRTMGASQGSILRVFFMSGASLGVIGTALGLIVGITFCVFIEQIQAFVEWVTGAEVFSSDIYFLSRLPARIEWTEVLFVIGWTLFMSCLATLPPALRASKLDPVEALRYE